MSKFTTPSRRLLSTFSQSLKYDKSLATPCQCRRLTTTGTSIRPRAQQSHLNPASAHNKRPFSVSFPRSYKTVEEQKSRYKSGPFSWQAGILFLSAGVGLVFYFRFEKARMERKRVAEASKGVGRPKVGGPFELVDQHGKPFTDADMKGKYSLVYFGFSHCPDICPEELDKMGQMIDIVNASSLRKPSTPPLLPIFITCDPARDTPAVLDAYLSEFHDGLIGLTGTWEQTKDVCKKYRVYFSTPPGVKPGEDYLVDHSIYFYLMDPEGDFVEAIGRQHSPQQAASIILDHMGDWKKR
ncbi:Thioredoxin-like protein [Venustampulla echinocandica]|uniref:Thioredoxin-like protein n=1 Tax=Venustampulla echinocandica TaxID=2656787 RepID=A0A370TKR8_9HELO|nr:Thioredoxin-like protein [Venustampulla echinocandica]RDL36105.1 Thioredoxin-like protein [Venustampulla echinocandica]